VLAPPKEALVAVAAAAATRVCAAVVPVALAQSASDWFGHGLSNIYPQQGCNEFASNSETTVEPTANHSARTYCRRLPSHSHGVPAQGGVRRQASAGFPRQEAAGYARDAFETLQVHQSQGI